MINSVDNYLTICRACKKAVTFFIFFSMLLCLAVSNRQYSNNALQNGIGPDQEPEYFDTKKSEKPKKNNDEESEDIDEPSEDESDSAVEEQPESEEVNDEGISDTSDPEYSDDSEEYSEEESEDE